MRVQMSGVVYANPKPYLRTRHAFHPTLVDLSAGELLCAYDIGEAPESVDYRTYRSRSLDGGATWQFEGPLLTDASTGGGSAGAGNGSHSIRISAAGGGLVGFGAVHQRRDSEQGLVNRENMGYVPMDLVLVRSRDQGANWSAPEIIEPPLVGPAFETCHAVVELPDGRWLAPTSTWRGWDGALPDGEKTVVLISADQGRTWPEYGVAFDGTAEDLTHWEVSLVRLSDTRLLAVSWVYDSGSGTHRPNRFALSDDAGHSFGPPGELGLHGQTCKALALQDGRVLFVYRRDDKPGLWATLSALDGDRWHHQEHLPLWAGGLVDSGMTGAGRTPDELAALKFGFPQMVEYAAGEVLLVFWCFEDWSTRIRWIRMTV